MTYVSVADEIRTLGQLAADLPTNWRPLAPAGPYRWAAKDRQTAVTVRANDPKALVLAIRLNAHYAAQDGGTLTVEDCGCRLTENIYRLWQFRCIEHDRRGACCDEADRLACICSGWSCDEHGTVHGSHD